MNQKPSSREPTPPNPYAPPAESRAGHAATLPSYAPAELIRLRHQWWENNVRSVGWLMIVVSITSVFLLALLESVPGGIGWQIAAWILTVTYFIVGVNVIRLRPASYLPAVILSFVLMLAIPCGTVAGLIMLPFLLAAPGRRVFGAEYQQVMKETSAMRVQTGRLEWTVLAIVLFFVCVAALLVLG